MGVCRPSKEEIGEYVDLVDRAQMLNAKMRDVSLQTLHFAERLVTGAVVMVDSDQNAGPRLAVVLGLDAAIKVLLLLQVVLFVRLEPHCCSLCMRGWEVFARHATESVRVPSCCLKHAGYSLCMIGLNCKQYLAMKWSPNEVMRAGPGRRAASRWHPGLVKEISEE